MQGGEQGDTEGRQGGHWLRMREAFPEQMMLEQDFSVRAWQNKGREHFASRSRECGTSGCYGMWAPKWWEMQRSAQGAMVP